MNHHETVAGHHEHHPPSAVDSHATAHHPGTSTYLIIFGVLMALLVLTVGIAYVDLGAFNLVAMLTIAVVKATLVVLFFMHVRYGTKLTWVFAGGGFFWLAIMLILTMNDYFSRGWFDK